MLLYTRKGWPLKVAKAFKAFYSRRQELTVEGDCLLWGTRVIIPKDLQTIVLQELHENHPGVSRMKSLARSYVWWSGLDQDIEECVKGCQPCQVEKNGDPSSAPLHPWLWPSCPWQRIHLDFAGPFLGSMFLICIDAHSKWPEVLEMKSTSAQKTITHLRNVFATHGLPQQVVTA